MLLKLYETNPNQAQIRHIAEVLRNKGIIIFPTDGVYAFGCDIFNAADVSPEMLLNTIEDWYANSCGLRFIQAVTTVENNPNEGFEDIIAQGEDWEEE